MAITDKGDNTGNVFIDALAAYSFLDIGGDRNITYTFATGGNISAHAWNSLTEKAQWQNALQQWVNVANITTQEVFSSDADLREAWVDTGQMTVAHGLGPDGLAYPSYHDLPQSGVGGPNGMYNRGYNTSFFPAAGVTTGGSGYWAFLHEIGRGLGLTPPFGTQDLENEPLFPGVTVSADLGDFGYNQMVYTTLSPNRGQYISGGNSFGYPVTPMAFDIAAIQFLYGPNTTFHSGSDGYGLPDENAPARPGNASGTPAGPTPSFMTEKRTPRSICVPRRSYSAIRLREEPFRKWRAFLVASPSRTAWSSRMRPAEAATTRSGAIPPTTSSMARRETTPPCSPATGRAIRFKTWETGSSSPVRTGPIRFSRSSM